MRIGIRPQLFLSLAIPALISLACAPAAPPAPTAAPPTPPAAAAPKPAATTAPAPNMAAPAKPAATAAPAKPAATNKEQVTLRLTIATSGIHAPYVVAQEKGYYDEAGLSVQLGDGAGSARSVQVVGAGADTFGEADGGTLAIMVGQGVPAKMIAGIAQLNPIGVVSLKDSGIVKPKDIEGKTVGYNPGGAAYTLFPAYAAATNIDVNKVKLINVDQGTRLTSIMDKRLDAGLEFMMSGAVPIQVKGKEINVQLYSDYGINTLSLGLVANSKYIEQKPDVVRRFVAASLKGWAFSLQNPDEAVNILLKKYPALDPKVSLGQLKVMLDSLHTAHTKGKPIGWMAEEDWNQTLDVLAKYQDLKNRQPASAYYTNEFIPSP